MVAAAVVSVPQHAITGPPESRSTYTRKDFPATLKKSADTDLKGLVVLLLSAWAPVADLAEVLGKVHMI